jgi:hypothetical protein
VNDTLYCSGCGAALAAGALYCSRCGTSVSAPAAPARAAIVSVDAPRARRPWWILGLPIAVVAVGLAVWALLAGMPARDRQSLPRVAAAAPDTIAEGEAKQTATVARIGEPAVPPPAPKPIVNVNVPMASASDELQIGEEEAVSKLRAFVASHENIAVECVSIRSNGLRNAGYTMDATNQCAATPYPVGRWRVDALNGDVFRQSADGRFLRP